MSAISSVRGIGVAVIVSTSTLRAELLQPFLVGDAEALLLVDDQQSQVLEPHVPPQQPVRADHDVHLPERRVLDHLLLRRRVDEPRQHLDRDRERREPFARTS